MAAPREECFAALFALIDGISDFKFKSRVWQSWDDTPPSQSPSVFLAKGPETSVSPQGMPPLWTLSARVIFYALNDEGRTVAPSTEINELLSALETALERKADEPPPSIPHKFLNNPPGSWGTTLGGLCYSCHIAGQIEVFEGLIGGNAMAVVTIDILTGS